MYSVVTIIFNSDLTIFCKTFCSYLHGYFQKYIIFPSRMKQKSSNTPKYDLKKGVIFVYNHIGHLCDILNVFKQTLFKKIFFFIPQCCFKFSFRGVNICESLGQFLVTQLYVPLHCTSFFLTLKIVNSPPYNLFLFIFFITISTTTIPKIAD